MKRNPNTVRRAREYVQRSGWRAIRFTNAEIYDGLEGVEARIAEALGET